MKTLKIFIIVLLAGSLLMGCVDEPQSNNNPTPSDYEGKLLIFQAYGSSNTAAGATHSFVELYNTTDSAINLNGISLY
ncbi:MAG: lamin tail domain-containing protein, partial [Treponema sp.]|nr:lamin tail domain-containing protein [Treponema sp.]